MTIGSRRWERRPAGLLTAHVTPQKVACMRPLSIRSVNGDAEAPCEGFKETRGECDGNLRKDKQSP